MQSMPLRLLCFFLVLCFIDGCAVRSTTSAPSAFKLNAPRGLALDARGNLYVANAGGNNVLVYDRSLTLQPARTITADHPTALAVDRRGALYVAGDGSVVWYHVASRPSKAHTLASGLGGALNLAIDRRGRILIANRESNEIACYNRFGALRATVAGDGSGHQLTAPRALAIRGNLLYVTYEPAGSHESVFVYNEAALLRGEAQTYQRISHGVTRPAQIAFDRSGNLYIANGPSGTTSKFDASGALVGEFAQGVPSAGGVAVDERGNVYVSDTLQNRVVVFNSRGKKIKELH